MFKKAIIKFFILLSGIVLAYTLISQATPVTTAVHNKLSPTTTLHIVFGDITKMKVDVIVNAANAKLLVGGGVCGAIFSAAQKKSLMLSHYIQQHYPQGVQPWKAVITPAFVLEKLYGIKHIIHAVGPIYKNYENKEEAAKILKQAYQESLMLASHEKHTAIAFPFLSSGIYGYPREEAAAIALQAIAEFAQKADAIKTTIKDIYFVLYAPEDFNLFVKTLSIKN